MLRLAISVGFPIIVLTPLLILALLSFLSMTGFQELSSVLIGGSLILLATVTGCTFMMIIRVVINLITWERKLRHAFHYCLIGGVILVGTWKFSRT